MVMWKLYQCIQTFYFGVFVERYPTEVTISYAPIVMLYPNVVNTPCLEKVPTTLSKLTITPIIPNYDALV